MINQNTITDQINELYAQIKQSENRDIADGMKRMGLLYTQNHGVPLAKLTQIAQKYSGQNALAKALRQTAIREMRLLAEMIDTHEVYTQNELEEIAQTLDTSELSEQFARHINKEIKPIIPFALQLTENSNKYVSASGFNILAYTARKLSDNDIETLFETIEHHQKICNHELQKYIARCLRKIAENSADRRAQVIAFINQLNEHQQNIELLTEETLALI